MDKKIKLGLYGLLTWLIPFLASFLFFSRTGGLLIDIFLFKSIMIVVGSLVGVGLLVYYFREISANYLKEGILVGAVWFVMNAVLDIVFLLPMSGDSVGTWFASIGMRYLVLPIISIGMGYLIQSNKK